MDRIPLRRQLTFAIALSCAAVCTALARPLAQESTERPDAAKLLEEAKKAYAGCESDRDAGSVTTVFVSRDPERPDETVTIPRNAGAPRTFRSAAPPRRASIPAEDALRPALGH